MVEQLLSERSRATSSPDRRSGSSQAASGVDGCGAELPLCVIESLPSLLLHLPRSMLHGTPGEKVRQLAVAAMAVLGGDATFGKLLATAARTGLSSSKHDTGAVACGLCGMLWLLLSPGWDVDCTEAGCCARRSCTCLRSGQASRVQRWLSNGIH